MNGIVEDAVLAVILLLCLWFIYRAMVRFLASLKGDGGCHCSANGSCSAQGSGEKMGRCGPSLTIPIQPIEVERKL